MTIAELIAILKDYPKDSNVLMNDKSTDEDYPIEEILFECISTDVILVSE